MAEQLRVRVAGEVRSYHDLEALADEIHRSYFPHVNRPHIRWGRKIGRRKRRSIRLGSYCHASKLIRIHPLLNSPSVPLYFIQSIIYHEYLHHILGAPHDRRFQRYERRFRYHREAREWLQRNLGVLLGLRERPARRIEPVPPPPAMTRPAMQLALFD